MKRKKKKETAVKIIFYNEVEHENDIKVHNSAFPDPTVMTNSFHTNDLMRSDFPENDLSGVPLPRRIWAKAQSPG